MAAYLNFLVLFICSIESSFGEITVSHTSIKENLNADSPKITVSWTVVKMLSVKFETTVGPNEDRYSTTCTFNPNTQECVSCSQNKGSNIQGDCSAPANTIFFTFTSLKVLNIGRHLIDLTETNADVNKRYVDVALNNAKVEITNKTVGDTTTATIIWSGITVTKVTVTKLDSSTTTGSCSVDSGTQKCQSCSMPNHITASCVTSKEIIVTFDSKMLDAGIYMIEVTHSNGDQYKIEIPVPKSSQSSTFTVHITFIAVLAIATFKLKEILTY